MITLILMTMLLTAGVFLVSMLMQSKILTSLTNETSDRQLSAMTTTTTGVIDTVVKQNMDRITDLEAMLTDEMFQNLAIRLQLVGDYARKLLIAPDGIPRVPWQRPDAAHDGELFVKALFEDGVDEAAVDDKLKLIANMTDLMVSLCTAYGSDNIWFTLPEGATLMADTVPSNWIGEDGAYVTYNASDRYWYHQALQERKLVFSDVEYDHRTGELCVTCALPVYGADGELLGVAGSDIFCGTCRRKFRRRQKTAAFWA